ncbi:MAG TPA: hypothetical protein VN611_15550 [Patescibacteria group bacterium]|nr:hypothetical protein [Patescibacteria group bacterium]
MSTQEIALRILRFAHSQVLQTGCRVIKIADLKKDINDLPEEELLAALQDLHETQRINAKFIGPRKTPVAFILPIADQEMPPAEEMAVPAVTLPAAVLSLTASEATCDLQTPFDHDGLAQLIKLHAGVAIGPELLKLHHQLQIAEEYNLSIPPGYLNQHLTMMDNHPWLTQQVANFLVKWVTRPPLNTA